MLLKRSFPPIFLKSRVNKFNGLTYPGLSREKRCNNFWELCKHTKWNEDLKLKCKSLFSVIWLYQMRFALWERKRSYRQIWISDLENIFKLHAVVLSFLLCCYRNKNSNKDLEAKDLIPKKRDAISFLRLVESTIILPKSAREVLKGRKLNKGHQDRNLSFCSSNSPKWL